jgi:hypothetical protein
VEAGGGGGLYRWSGGGCGDRADDEGGNSQVIKAIRTLMARVKGGIMAGGLRGRGSIFGQPVGKRKWPNAEWGRLMMT